MVLSASGSGSDLQMQRLLRRAGRGAGRITDPRDQPAPPADRLPRRQGGSRGGCGGGRRHTRRSRPHSGRRHPARPRRLRPQGRRCPGPRRLNARPEAPAGSRRLRWPAMSTDAVLDSRFSSCDLRRTRANEPSSHRGAPRRGGRAVDCTALEMRHGCKPIGGSNPPLSAKSSRLGELLPEKCLCPSCIRDCTRVPSRHLTRNGPGPVFQIRVPKAFDPGLRVAPDSGHDRSRAEFAVAPDHRYPHRDGA